MTGRNDKEREALRRLADDLVEDILNLSDEEILAETREEGVDPERQAAEMQTLFQRAALRANKERLAMAKAAVVSNAGRALSGAPTRVIDIGEARHRLRRIMSSQPVTLAARNETEMTDSDVLSMLEDLRELGLLDPGDEK